MKNISDREYGIDALRILTSFMVVVLHLLFYGDLLTHAQRFSFSYYSCLILGIFFDCAVICFGLISGFIGYDRKYKISNILFHHFTVLFFTLLITIVSKIIAPGQFRLSSILTALSPITSSTYWYYTAYFGLFLLIPAINAAVSSLKKRQLDFLLIMLLLFLSAIPCILDRDIFHTKNGYSVFWLAVLYFIGAYLKKYHAHYKKSPARHFTVYIISVLSVCVLKFSHEFIVYAHNGSTVNYLRFIEYTSPFILLSGISLLLMFSSLHFSQKTHSTIRFFSRSSFSTYILHEHPFVRAFFISKQLKYVLQLPALLHVPAILVRGIVIWLACVAIDQLRMIAFKLLHTEKHLNQLEKFFTSLRLYGQ